MLVKFPHKNTNTKKRQTNNQAKTVCLFKDYPLNVWLHELLQKNICKYISNCVRTQGHNLKNSETSYKSNKHTLHKA